jgi:hypothetical protein
MSNLYFPRIGLPILLQTDPWEYINHSQTHECRKWERGCAVSFLGIHISDFRYSVLCEWSRERKKVGVPEHGGRPSVGRGDEQHMNPTWQ